MRRPLIPTRLGALVSATLLAPRRRGRRYRHQCSPTCGGAQVRDAIEVRVVWPTGRALGTPPGSSRPNRLRSIATLLVSAVPAAANKSAIRSSWIRTAPALGVGLVAVVRHRRIGTVIDEEPHGVLIPLNRRFVKNARRLVRRPVGVDVGAALEEKRRNLEVPIQNRPRERDVQNLLSRRRSPLQVGAGELGIAVRVVMRQRSQNGPAGCVEPARHRGRVANTSRVRQVVGQRPDARQNRDQMRISIRSA